MFIRQGNRIGIIDSIKANKDGIRERLKEVAWNDGGAILRLPQIDSLLCNFDKTSNFLGVLYHFFIPRAKQPQGALESSIAETKTLNLAESSTDTNAIHICFEITSHTATADILSTNNGVRLTLTKSGSTATLSLNLNGTLSNNSLFTRNISLNGWHDVVIISNQNKVSFIIDGVWSGAANTDAALSFDTIKLNTDDFNAPTATMGAFNLATLRVWKSALNLDEVYFTRAFNSPNRLVLPAISKMLCNLDTLSMIPNGHKSYLIAESKQGYFMKGSAALNATSGTNSVPNGLTTFNSYAAGNNSSLGVTNDMLSFYIGKNHNNASNFVSYKMPFSDVKKQMSFSVLYRSTNQADYRGEWGLTDSKIRVEYVGSARKLYSKFSGAVYENNNSSLTFSTANGGYNLTTLTIDNSTDGVIVVKGYVNGSLQSTMRVSGDLGVENRVYFCVKFDGTSSFYAGSSMFIRSLRAWECVLTDAQVAELWKYENARM